GLRPDEHRRPGLAAQQMGLRGMAPRGRSGSGHGDAGLLDGWSASTEDALRRTRDGGADLFLDRHVTIRLEVGDVDGRPRPRRGPNRLRTMTCASDRIRVTRYRARPRP